MSNSNNIHHNIQNGTSVPWKITDVAFTLFVLFILSMVYIGSLLYANIDVNMSFFIIMFQILLSLSTLALIYTIVTRKYNMPFNEAFGISFEKMPAFFSQGLFVTVLIIISTTVISFIFVHIIGIEKQNPYGAMSQESFKWLTLLAVFSAPVVEEIFFRGFMQPAIIKITGSFLGILITALIFSVAHTQYIDYGAAFFSVWAIGLILGITRYKTNSVMPGIFAHFFNNLLAVIYILN